MSDVRLHARPFGLSGSAIVTMRGDNLQPFYDVLAADDLSALWVNLGNLAPPEPPKIAQPKLWKAALIEDRVAEAGRVISAEQAERRVIVFENPGLPGQSAITPSLYSGVQLILPGESARSHRHTAAALRLVLSGEGGYTAVEGERVSMAPGDFIVTPAWTWHDHGNDGASPVTWLDGLDVHVVNLLGAPFGELHSQTHQPLARPEGDAMARYAGGVMPVGHVNRGASSPLFHYPIEKVRTALDAMAHSDAPDPAHGLRVTYTDPTTGRSPIATMSAFMQRLPAGFDGIDHRSTDGTVFCVVEGTGQVRVGDGSWQVGKHDVFVVPSWQWRQFKAESEMLIFSFSDRVLQETLGFWREERRAETL